MNPGHRPWAVTILGWVYIVVGAVGFAAHIGDLRGGDPFRFDGIGVELVRLLAVVAGVFMLRGENWARWLAVAWMGFHVVVGALNGWGQAAIHALFLAVIVWLLFRGEAELYFRGAAGRDLQ